MRFKEIDFKCIEKYDCLIYCYLTSSLTKEDYKKMNVVKSQKIGEIIRSEVLTDVFSIFLMYFYEEASRYGLIYFLSDGIIYQIDKKIKKSEEFKISIDNLSDRYKIVDVICAPTARISGHKNEGRQFDLALRLFTEVSENSIIIKLDKFDRRFFWAGIYTEIEIDALAILKEDDNSAEGNWRKAVELFRKDEYRGTIEFCNRAYDRALRDFLNDIKNTENINVSNDLMKKLDNVEFKNLGDLVKIFDELIKVKNGIKLLGNIRKQVGEMNSLRVKDAHRNEEIDKLLTKEKIEKYIIATYLLIKYFTLKIPFQSKENIISQKEKLFSNEIKREGYYGVALNGINKQIK